ncbi:SURF1 family protein [Moritella sp. 24]|uniref:SURF1 family protein n=1 Tax=Moritella sp. 24 TaxID=2746230 RepID=UPI001BAD0E62|nr:SURF1 family protein [Moritella sp. 24]QUM77576.1 SURF1 family protein [Moritella sp. 24]
MPKLFSAIQWHRLSKRLISFVLFSLLAVAVCINLGLWQLSRAQEKQTLLDIDKPTLISLAQINADSLHQKITLDGYFDNRTPILLDNQTYQKQFGYHLYLPFHSGEHTILVNLGWLAGSADRLSLPVIPVYTGRYQLSGTLSAQQGSPLLLGDNISSITNKPLVVQRTDTKQLGTYLHSRFMPLLLQLDHDANIGFIKTWNITVMPPAKHTAYAIQWFTLAFALVLCSGVWLKKYRTYDKNMQDKD